MGSVEAKGFSHATFHREGPVGPLITVTVKCRTAENPVLKEKRAVLQFKEDLLKTPVAKDVVSLLSGYFKLLSIQGVRGTETVGSWEEAMKRRVDMAISVGGDGTLLGVSRFLPPEVPILGVSMGGRGAIVEVGPNDLPLVMKTIEEGDYYLEKRLRIASKIGDFTTYHSLNELYIRRAHFYSTPTFRISSEAGFEIDRRMDGIIVATPTGSSGYNLSNRGPVLIETMQSLILNPVMPIDMLPAIVIPPAKVNISCNDSLYVILDGQVSYEVKPGEKVHIYRGDDLTLVKLSRTSLHQFSRIFK